jgi:hypothetical protein
MSNDPNPNAVSTMSSVISSIENDRYTYRWFLTLICLPEVQKGLSAQNKAQEDYAALKMIQINKIVLYLLLVGVILFAYLIRQPLVVLIELVPLAALVYLFRKNCGRVAAISRQFLLENISSDELERQTLYQISEYFSKKYNIPSLVDITAGQDSIGRKVILGAIFFLPFIYALSTRQLLLVSFIAFCASLAIVNTAALLRKFK